MHRSTIFSSLDLGVPIVLFDKMHEKPTKQMYLTVTGLTYQQS